MVELFEKGFDFDKYENYNTSLFCDENDIDFTIKKILINEELNTKPGLDITYVVTDKLEVNLTNLPSHIKYLRLHAEPVMVYFPDTLEYIELSLFKISEMDSDRQANYINLFKNIKWPSNLKSLRVNLLIYNSNYVIANEDINEGNMAMYIPYNLEYLRVNCYVSNIHKFTKLKTYIIDLHNNNECEYTLDSLPPSLEWLEIMPYNFNHPLNNLPANLKILKFGQFRLWNICEGYKHPINNLPIGLEVLYFPECTTVECTSLGVEMSNLPPNLKILFIPRYIPIDIDINSLPDSIEVLNWYNFIEHHERFTNYPKNLKKINVNKKDYEELISSTKYHILPFKIEVCFENYRDFTGLTK